MELDDLKKQWMVPVTPVSADKIKEAIERKISKLERSGRGLKKAFWIEMAFIWGIYSSFLFAMFFFSDHILPYMYKIVVLIGVSTAPIVWRLYKAQRWINSIDYSKDVRSNVKDFVKYYKATLIMYEWATYVIVVLTFVLMYFDSSFRLNDPRIKWIFIGYMMVIVAITRPYIYFVYGKKLAIFEDFLRD